MGRMTKTLDGREFNPKKLSLIIVKEHLEGCKAYWGNSANYIEAVVLLDDNKKVHNPTSSKVRKFPMGNFTCKGKT